MANKSNPLAVRYFIALAACMFTFVLAIPSAEAAVIITAEQVGNDVVITGSGSYNLSALTLDDTLVTGGAGIRSGSAPFMHLGSLVGSSTDFYTGLGVPLSYGTGPFAEPDLGSGGPLGVNARGGPYLAQIMVPAGYVSGNPLSSSNSFLSTTLADLGLTVDNDTVWSWGLDANADSMTFQVIPEPASAALLGAGGLALMRRQD